MPSVADRKAIAKLNKRISADLGNRPRYAWTWSPDMTIKVSKRYLKSLDPRYVEGKTESGLYVMVPELDEFQEMMMPGLPPDMWVFTFYNHPADSGITEQAWDEGFKGVVAYPYEGQWLPVGISTARSKHHKVFALPSVGDVKGNLDWTLGQIRYCRSFTGKDLERISEEQEARAKEKRLSDGADNFAEMFGTRDINPFDTHVPGWKDKTSYPTPSKLQDN